MQPPAVATPGTLAAAVEAELEAAGRAESALGQVAIALAKRLAEGRDTGAAVASLTRELRATLEVATAGARVEASPLEQARDELAERRRHLRSIKGDGG